MIPLPWRAHAVADPNRQYLALLSYLPLRSFRMIPKFLQYARQTQQQLASAKGLVGYSMHAQILRRRFWTLSVWEDQNALSEFVHTAPHGRIMQELVPHMGNTQFEEWKVKGSELPLAWKPALARIRPR